MDFIIIFGVVGDMQTGFIYQQLWKNLSGGDCTQICHNYDSEKSLQYALKCIIQHITSV